MLQARQLLPEEAELLCSGCEVCSGLCAEGC
jgi:MinD superfamily P-loop ATPase